MARVAIVFDVPNNAKEDEKDVLLEASAVTDALLKLGCEVSRYGFSTDIEKFKKVFAPSRSDVIFNLVESVESKGKLIALAPMIFDHMGIPYTGSEYEAVMCTTNKVVAKRIMSSVDIMTPYYQRADDVDKIGVWIDGTCIVKNVWEHASIGLDEDSVIENKDDIVKRIKSIDDKDRKNWFVEQFIKGREFNVSIIERDGIPLVLPPVEMVFDFPEGKPAIVGYTAKWKEESFEYKHSNRRFDFDASDDSLIHRIKEVSEKCWHTFGLKGYARVDFRVDESGMPWVLEVNVNPCISPDAGFIAAAKRSGIDYEEVVRMIIVSVLENDKKNDK